MLTRCPAREQLRDVLGDDVVDQLSDLAAGRVLGALFAAAQRELARLPDPGQLELDPAA